MFDVKIKDFMMREALIVSMDDDLAKVASQMANTGKDVAIVMEGESIKGLVTVNDIINATKQFVLRQLSFDKIPKAIREVQVQELLQNQQAKEFMEACENEGTNPVVALGEDDSMIDAFKLMSSSGVSHLVVVSQNGGLGTLSAHDVIKVYK